MRLAIRAITSEPDPQAVATGLKALLSGEGEVVINKVDPYYKFEGDHSIALELTGADFEAVLRRLADQWDPPDALDDAFGARWAVHDSRQHGPCRAKGVY